MITPECIPVNSISKASMRSIVVLSIEVAIMARSIPPRSFKFHSTVGDPSVIVLVKCSEGCTIVSSQGITCCACIATNVEAILCSSVANRKETIVGKCLYTIKISKAHFELSLLYPRSEAVNVLQSQPVFTIRVTEAIDIAGPVAVEVNRAIQSLLDDLPLSVHIAVHLEWFTTTRVNGVHS